MKEEGVKFYYLFWFTASVFFLSFVAMMLLLFVDIPERNREMASNAQGFLQGSLMMSAIGYLLSGNISNPKKEQKVTTEVTQEGTTITEEPITHAK